MLVDFFLKLRQVEIPVSITEYLTLLNALDHHQLTNFSPDDFYYLARTTLIKDERH
jgi:uncharacterized protein with von Willebrand factor type A (vWA) domain